MAMKNAPCNKLYNKLMLRFVLSKIRVTKNPKDMRNRALLNEAETFAGITG